MAYSTAQFESQAPEFNWTNAAACSATAVNCMSFVVADDSTAGDSQVLSLAVLSSKTNTCWYAFDLEASPGGQLTDKFPTAGVWYATG